jgi:hypothetical protein
VTRRHGGGRQSKLRARPAARPFLSARQEIYLNLNKFPKHNDASGPGRDAGHLEPPAESSHGQATWKREMTDTHPERKYIKLAILVVVSYSMIINIISLLIYLLSLFIPIPLHEYMSNITMFLVILLTGAGGLTSILSFPFYASIAIGACIFFAYAAIKLCSIIFLMLFIITWLVTGFFGVVHAY